MAEEYIAPPTHLIRLPYHHWIQPTDFEGRAMHGPKVMQWQPAAKSWCYSGNIATGQAIQLDATVNRYLCPCAELDIESDLTILQNHSLRHQVTKLLKAIRPEGSHVVRTFKAGEGKECWVKLEMSSDEYRILLELLKMYANPI